MIGIGLNRNWLYIYGIFLVILSLIFPSDFSSAAFGAGIVLLGIGTAVVDSVIVFANKPNDGSNEDENMEN